MAAELANILDMLQERSQRGRDLVFRHVADLVLSGNLPEATDDRAALIEILKILRPNVSPGVRRELSGHLYSMENPPESLLEIMLEDEDSVSGPLLDYAAIPESILNRLIEQAPIEVLSRIKRRSDLSDSLRAKLNKQFASAAPPETMPRTGSHSADRKTVPLRQKPAESRAESPAVAATKPGSTPLRTPGFHRPALSELLANDPADAPTGAVTSTAPSSSPSSSGQKPERAASRQPAPYAATDSLNLAIEGGSKNQGMITDFVRISSAWQWETDRYGQITYLSEAAVRAFGRPTSSLLDQPLVDVIANTQATPEGAMALARAFDRRSAFDQLAVATTGLDGSCTWEMAAVPVFDVDSGRFKGYRGIAEAVDTDAQAPITPRIKSSISPATNMNGLLGTNIRRPEPTRASEVLVDRHIGDMIQSLSHELRTPLNAILGFSEMIELETWGKVNKDYHNCVRSIMEAARQLNDLITDILENTRIRPELSNLYPKSFSLSSVIRDSVNTVKAQAERRDMTITAPAEGLKAIVYSDPRLVQYSLVRLLRCALDDSHRGTGIALELTTRDDGSVDIDIRFRPETVRTGFSEDYSSQQSFNESSGTPKETGLAPHLSVPHLSALSRFRIKLAVELASAIGATVGERLLDQKGTARSSSGGSFYVLSLRLPPHDRFPAAA